MSEAYKTVVPPSVVASHLDGTWALVDCRFDLQHPGRGRDQYVASHVPSAVYADLSRDLSGAVTGRNGRHPLPPVDEMAATFSRWGIDSHTQVVVYDQDIGTFAGRLWWMLRYMGHEAVAVLDGGMARWTAEGRPVRTGEERRPAAAFVAALRPGMVASIEDVEDTSAAGGRLLVDARAPERYAGRQETLDKAAGHIPGAVNRFYKANVTPDGTLQSPDELRRAYAGVLAGRRPADVVMYCGSGVTACHNLLAMEHAGLTGARLYPGSWSEWSSDPARPVETGEG